MAKLDDRIRHLEGKKRFDASKAFQHSKENAGPAASPLKEGKALHLFESK